MNCLPLMHGCDWTGEDVSGWWLSEKLDGWRVLWTGSEFMTRHSITLDAPNWFKAGMPDTPLDGELWAGPGTNHDDVNVAVRSGDWTRLTFRPFDIPSMGVKCEAAMAILASLSLPKHVKPVEYQRVESTTQAKKLMRQIVRAGGEGVMLRKPGSGYSPNYRTAKLLKLKP